MWYGAAYYPEHWPEERWAADARLMKLAGFNVVRLGEFAWCRMEPEADRFEFDWLDRAIDALSGEGIRVLLGTPTAGPPSWLVNAPSPHLDCRMVYEDGARWQFGGRSLCCVNHPRFIERSVRIADAMGQRYARHPAVMGWQLDNELGMYGVRCRCLHCVAKFRRWLRNKYGDIAELNRRLGTVFGGGEFRGFDDVPLPNMSQDLHNPGLLLDSQRFFSESNADYLAAQARALRAAGADQPITHNVCHMFGGGRRLDEHLLFEALDVAGWDCYPQQFAVDPAPATLGLLHAVTRGFKDRPYWMLEQQSGAPFGMPADDPRRIRLWAWQSLAHGAEMILFFRWRTCRFGGEQYWRGILDHSGAPNPRYEAIAGIGRQLRELEGRLDGLRHTSRAAILLDYESCESFALGATQGGPRLDYRKHAESCYEALRCRGIGTDVVYALPDPGRYELVVAPALRLMDAERAQQLRGFVERGGTLVGTICTATLTRDHVAPTEPVPWRLDDVFGVRRVEWSGLGQLATPPKERLGEDAAVWEELGSPEEIPIIGTPGPLQGQYTARVWCDHLESTTADVWARFAAGSPPGAAPAITCNHYGKGRAVYVAAVVDQPLLNQLIAALIEPPADAPVADNEQVEIIRRESRSECVYFILNHGHESARVILPAGFELLLPRVPSGAPLELLPYDVAIAAACGKPEKREVRNQRSAVRQESTGNK